ncbi:MAG TPA: SDR family NAD(P)-dependent oxidoreductase, partial [Pyrinomonadaceae bacterium]|nr:SDR family NAD(P)-dependent oxidoreductase [Pyrinomonadaceae bacterium]
MTFSKLDLSGRTAVVIGGTSGIGRAIALGMADAGADVVCSSRRIDQVNTTAAEVEAKGRRTIRVASDVSERPSIENLLDECTAVFGKVDILVNSA